MKAIRRFLYLFFAALIITSYGGMAHAESPLRQNEPVIQQISQEVDLKKAALGNQTNQILELLQKEKELSSKLKETQKKLDELNQKLEQKRVEAAAEKKRLAEIQNLFVHVNQYAPDSAGNLYDSGSCTWYVKNRRPDLPNNLGNANTWYYMAQADGFSVGSTPKKGAVATTTAGWFGHVAYVEGVTPDGLWVTISEMNVNGLYSMGRRTVYYTEFQYIYQLN